LKLRPLGTIALSAAIVSSPAVAQINIAPTSAQCPHGAPVYEQDNRVREGGAWHVTRHVSAYRLTGSDAAFYESGLAIDADGAPNAYHPDGTSGLDSLSAAGYPRSCSVLVCVGKTPGGANIYARTHGGPFDGFFVSMSTLMDERKKPDGSPLHPKTDYRRYVDSTTVPYVAIAQRAMKPFNLDRGLHPGRSPGEVAYVVNLRNGRGSAAAFADVGTNNTLGEGSIALAKALGLTENQQSPRHGGVALGILTIVFPNSKTQVPWPRTPEDLTAAAEQKFKDWGGLERVKACFPTASLS
jgi:hypothetical protein